MAKQQQGAGPLALSPSRIEAAACPYRFQQVHLLKAQKEPETQPLGLGQLMHQVASQYLEHLRATDHQTDHLALAAISDRLWRERLPIVSESASDDFRTMVGNLREFSVNPKEIAAVEAQVAFDANWNQVEWFSKAAAFRTIFDLVTRTRSSVHIRDWTTAQLGGEFERKKDLQLRAYGLVASRLYGETDIEITTHSLRSGIQVVVQLTQQDHEEALERIDAERDRLATIQSTSGTKPWPAVPGHYCAFCRIPCPLEADALERGFPLRIASQDQAQLAHQALILVERRKKVLTDLLKSYVSAHGPVESNGLEATFRPAESVQHDPTLLIRALRARSFSQTEIAGVLKVDNYALRRLLKNLPELLEELEGQANKASSARFYPMAVKKAGAEGGGDD